MHTNQIGRMQLCILQVSHSGTVLDVHSVTATLLSPLAPVEGKICDSSVGNIHVYNYSLLSNHMCYCGLLNPPNKCCNAGVAVLEIN